MLSPFPLILLLLFPFTNLVSGQISLSDPIYSGTFCTPEATSSGLQLKCNGKGFFIVDPLAPFQTTTMTFQIVSKIADFGVGLGQRPDSSCLSSMFPLPSQAWATCPPTSSANNEPCNTNKCYFNRATAYTTSAYRSQLPPNTFATLQSSYTYQWKFQPPTCPLDPTTPNDNCWQVTYLRKF